MYKRGYHNGRGSKLQRGTIIVWVTFGLTAFVALAAMSVDVGLMYWHKSEAMKAADAAALAGAWQLTVAGNTVANARTAANNYASYNGYPTPTYAGYANNGADQTRFTVSVSKVQPRYFAGLFSSAPWHATFTSTAEYKVATSATYNLSQYGYAYDKNGLIVPYNYSMFGPYAYHSYGDEFSTKYLNYVSANGLQNNPRYNSGGYNFGISVPSDYATRNAMIPTGTNNALQTNPHPSYLQLEIFDPSTNTSSPFDEDRPWNPGMSPTPTTTLSTTVYTLQYQAPGATSYTDITSSTFSNESAAMSKWVTPSGFTIDTAAYPSGSLFQVNAKTTYGSSENGFLFRAGPPHAMNTTLTNNAGGNYQTSAVSEATWVNNWSGISNSGYNAGGGTATQISGGINGTGITANGRIPLNVNRAAALDIVIGYIPAIAAGGQVSVTRFDTDIGATALYYWCDAAPGTHYATTNPLGQDDREYTDAINIPANYTGGTWHAAYTAGSTDTSSWDLGYWKVALVGSAGLSY